MIIGSAPVSYERKTKKGGSSNPSLVGVRKRKDFHGRGSQESECFSRRSPSGRLLLPLGEEETAGRSTGSLEEFPRDELNEHV